MSTRIIPSLIVPNSRPNRKTIAEGIDTGITDGSGELSVQADEAKIDGINTIFIGVAIFAKNPNGSDRGYGEWHESSLKSCAIDMLRRDYCK